VLLEKKKEGEVVIAARINRPVIPPLPEASDRHNLEMLTAQLIWRRLFSFNLLTKTKVMNYWAQCLKLMRAAVDRAVVEVVLTEGLRSPHDQAGASKAVT
jgi:hypothetical protein